jgi:DNA-binding MarR family transcriptional regulator/N-acetylglutamate synthase-like GNAT family acetyltransferase
MNSSVLESNQQAQPEDSVAAVRRFNRFYTRQIGVLEEGLLKRSFTLTEVRVMYELAHRDQPTAAELGRDLGIDPGYLSRILHTFSRGGLVKKAASASDARQVLLRLTRKGRETFAALDARANDAAKALLQNLSPSRKQHLLGAMETVEKILGPQKERHAPYILRPLRPGDMGWIVHRHGVLYSEEYGWDERFEGLVAGIAAKFIENYDPQREHCWIAECNNEILGCVFLVRHTKTVGKLRLLLVEPSARGLGLGQRLVEECIRFGRQAGYRKIVLWTNDVLKAARHIYQKAGFRRVRKERHHSFGHDLTSETWELKL